MEPNPTPCAEPKIEPVAPVPELLVAVNIGVAVEEVVVPNGKPPEVLPKVGCVEVGPNPD